MREADATTPRAFLKRLLIAVELTPPELHRLVLALETEAMVAIVSTDRQGKSGLGLDAQRDAIARFAETEGLEPIGELVEVETARGAERSNGGRCYTQL